MSGSTTPQLPALLAVVATTGDANHLINRPNGSVTKSFGGGEVVVAGTYEWDMPYPTTIASLKYKVGTAGGSFTAAVTINGVAVTGLSAVTVSSNTVATALAAALGACIAGDVAALVISAVTGSPTGGRLVVTFTKP